MSIQGFGQTPDERIYIHPVDKPIPLSSTPAGHPSSSGSRSSPTERGRGLSEGCQKHERPDHSGRGVQEGGIENRAVQ
jgi:hypothetical protein